MRAVLLVFAVLMLLFGTLQAVFGLAAFIDPADAQLANDSDPFGTPPSRATIALQTAFGAMVAGCGFVLIVRHRRDAG